jgi:hypothetical protein
MLRRSGGSQASDVRLVRSAPGLAGEGAQQPERSRCQIDRLAAAPQQRIGLVELELAEANAQRAGSDGGQGYLPRIVPCSGMCLAQTGCAGNVTGTGWFGDRQALQAYCPSPICDGAEVPHHWLVKVGAQW